MSMIIEPKIRGFICTTAHPAGCAANVRQQIDYVKQHAQVVGPKKVLVIGASTGYGLASRIAAAFGSHAATIGVFFEKSASGKRTASAGWYNTAAFEEAAQEPSSAAFLFGVCVQNACRKVFEAFEHGIDACASFKLLMAFNWAKGNDVADAW